MRAVRVKRPMGSRKRFVDAEVNASTETRPSLPAEIEDVVASSEGVGASENAPLDQTAVGMAMQATGRLRRIAIGFRSAIKAGWPRW
jgi:hypothetical protein